jgi:hypothetical protein
VAFSHRAGEQLIRRTGETTTTNLITHLIPEHTVLLRSPAHLLSLHAVSLLIIVLSRLDKSPFPHIKTAILDDMAVISERRNNLIIRYSRTNS